MTARVRLAVLGDPLRYTRSPDLHRAGAAALGLDCESHAVRTPLAALGETLARLAAEGYTGCNLTMPLKEAALACVRETTPTARRARSINTVTFLAAGSSGDTTDGVGFVELHEAHAVRGVARAARGEERDRVDRARPPRGRGRLAHAGERRLLQRHREVAARVALRGEARERLAERRERRAHGVRLAVEPQRGRAGAVEVRRARVAERIAQHREPHPGGHGSAGAGVVSRGAFRRRRRTMSTANRINPALISWLSVTSSVPTRMSTASVS